MNDPNNQPPQRGVSPVLLIFLAFPLIGLVAAASLIFNGDNQRQANSGLPTPAAVTLPPMPTPINLADTPVIDFALTSFEGELVNAREYVGRVVFLNFWATWCEPVSYTHLTLPTNREV